MLPDATQLAAILGAIGALGAAASGLVDTTKWFTRGISHVGLKTIRAQIKPFDALLATIPENAAFETINGLWINGTAIGDQKAKVKALIKLGLQPATVEALARATGLDREALNTLAQKIATGTDLTPAEVNIYGHLDAILSAVIDAAYEKADQHYRNAAKLLAAAIAVVLALVGGYAVSTPFDTKHLLLAVLVGLVATPLAPVTKDLTSALSVAVQASGKLRALVQ